MQDLYLLLNAKHLSVSMGGTTSFGCIKLNILMKTLSKVSKGKKSHRDKFNKKPVLNWCSCITYSDIVKENQL